MLTEIDRAMVLALAECNMNATEVARINHYHRNTVVFHMNRVQRETGLDPRRFYDLVSLVEMVGKNG